MTDCFALLGQPRRPWLDADALKEKFHQLTSQHHPDVSRGSDVDFSALNHAYNTLRDPRTRIRHWLELEFPDGLRRNQQVPAAISELFAEMGAKRSALDAFLAKQSRSAAPLAQALLASEKFALLDDLEKWLAILNQKQSLFLHELESLDATNKARVADIYQHFSYLSKWSDQIREGVVKLGMM